MLDPNPRRQAKVRQLVEVLLAVPIDSVISFKEMSLELKTPEGPALRSLVGSAKSIAEVEGDCVFMSVRGEGYRRERTKVVGAEVLDRGVIGSRRKITRDTRRGVRVIKASNDSTPELERHIDLRLKQLGLAKSALYERNLPKEVREGPESTTESLRKLFELQQARYEKKRAEEKLRLLRDMVRATPPKRRR